ncbi:bifunctional metallophosphatase/5'-nucleotidase [Oceanobacillus zhaokaii]|uniref:Bifunctional metallophosphatase/5'-nucleotidase n=1 Tax=Oceanobacillus zhaokaii TaxID=2052660 RepID=A0A345PDE6_9BACI|nr:bifunctional UDP-sugar hydrolase/5'-nucleotidase [Oceanobacillus zhaokaii]AXI08026.1 bifunctional metallophosphatase/5'-nucleotidase [Oceanobacillus zhaokaii]
MTNKTAKVNILYTSDIHGHVLPMLYGTSKKADIGLAKYATVVKESRARNKDVIVLDNGDLIQGTPLMTYYVNHAANIENPMIGIFNQLEIDAGVIGNHEFNFGKKVLIDAYNQSNYPWISANVLDLNSGDPLFGPPYIIKTISNGVRVAIVAVTTHYIPNWESPNHIKDIQFADAFSTLQKWVNHIRESDKPDVLIAAYHGGLERDPKTGEPTETLTGENQGYQMCEQINGIDVLLTGHQHRTLISKCNGVLVIQPGNNGRAYGEIEIKLEKNNNHWQISDIQGHLRTLENIEPDPWVIDYMEELEESTQNWLDQPVGNIEGDMRITDPLQARIKKHAFIQFIQDVQIDVSGVDISITALLNNTSTGFGPTVTMRDIVENYMYPNTLVILELTGEDIKAALEKSAAYFMLNEHGQIVVNHTYLEPKPQHYNYDMWEGIEYVINVANPIGSRVESIKYHGENLVENKPYNVVLNNYRASGGGDYLMFRNKPVKKEIQRDTVELIHAYFKKNKTVQAHAVNNFIIKSDNFLGTTDKS